VQECRRSVYVCRMYGSGYTCVLGADSYIIHIYICCLVHILWRFQGAAFSPHTSTTLTHNSVHTRAHLHSKYTQLNNPYKQLWSPLRLAFRV
jgi:hypothetical protein